MLRRPPKFPLVSGAPEEQSAQASLPIYPPKMLEFTGLAASLLLPPFISVVRVHNSAPSHPLTNGPVTSVRLPLSTIFVSLHRMPLALRA